MKIIDEHTFEGKGYHPFLITEQVAGSLSQLCGGRISGAN